MPPEGSISNPASDDQGPRKSLSLIHKEYNASMADMAQLVNYHHKLG